jgi:hypothetical protein
MGVQYNETFKGYRTAKELLLAKPYLLNRDGVYTLCPDGTINSAIQVYCDMTTDGGGWMLMARSHPDPALPSQQVPNVSGITLAIPSGSFGWQGAGTGSIFNFSAPYQLPWLSRWHSNGNTFTEFIFGNRQNIINNQWGPFIYKHSVENYSGLMTTDNAYVNSTRTVVKSTTSVYGTASFPVMQNYYGYGITGTTGNYYFFRDVVQFGAVFGAYPGGMLTTYVNDAANWQVSGPWGATGVNFNVFSAGIESSGDFIQIPANRPAGNTNYGGTTQFMVMVR